MVSNDAAETADPAVSRAPASNPVTRFGNLIFFMRISLLYEGFVENAVIFQKDV
jgi:hypothetical protein